MVIILKQQYLEAGKIVGTHGVRGEMKVEVWMDSPEFMKKIKNLYLNGNSEPVKMNLTSARVHKNMLLITLLDINSATEADLMRGKTVYADRNDVKLPAKRYFISDLIGLEVYDGENGQYYGRIQDVLMTGANNVYSIVNGDKEYLFPAVDHMIKSTDIDAGRIEILPIAGIFDEDAVNICE